MSQFTERVYQAVSKVPQGKVVSYAWVAEMVGSPRAVRAVGVALRKNINTAYSKTDKVIPCHRVVRVDGFVGEYNGGRNKKIALLHNEGIIVNNGKVDPELFWNKKVKITY